MIPLIDFGEIYRFYVGFLYVRKLSTTYIAFPYTNKWDIGKNWDGANFPTFSESQAPKLLLGSENVWGCKWYGYALSAYKLWWRFNGVQRQETEKSEFFNCVFACHGYVTFTFRAKLCLFWERYCRRLLVAFDAVLEFFRRGNYLSDGIQDMKLYRQLAPQLSLK